MDQTLAIYLKNLEVLAETTDWEGKYLFVSKNKTVSVGETKNPTGVCSCLGRCVSYLSSKIYKSDDDFYTVRDRIIEMVKYALENGNQDSDNRLCLKAINKFNQLASDLDCDTINFNDVAIKTIRVGSVAINKEDTLPNVSILRASEYARKMHRDLHSQEKNLDKATDKKSEVEFSREDNSDVRSEVSINKVGTKSRFIEGMWAEGSTPEVLNEAQNKAAEALIVDTVSDVQENRGEKQSRFVEKIRDEEPKTSEEKEENVVPVELSATQPLKKVRQSREFAYLKTSEGFKVATTSIEQESSDRRETRRSVASRKAGS